MKYQLTVLSDNDSIDADSLWRLLIEQGELWNHSLSGLTITNSAAGTIPPDATLFPGLIGFWEVRA